MSEIDQNTPGFGNIRFHFSRGWNSSACGFNCSSMGTITAIPCIGRSTVRNTFSSDSLYSSFTFRTRSSEPLLTSITRPRRYVARLSFPYRMRQTSPTHTFLWRCNHLYDGTNDGNTTAYHSCHQSVTKLWRNLNLRVIRFSESKGPWGTSLVARPKMRSLGVMGSGWRGSEPDTIPIGLLLMIFAISKNTIWSWENVHVWQSVIKNSVTLEKLHENAVFIKNWISWPRSTIFSWNFAATLPWA